MRVTTLVVAFLLFALGTATGGKLDFTDTKDQFLSVKVTVFLYLPTVALNVTATKKTCGSITIYLTSNSQEPSRNNPVIIRILYSSSVHSGEVSYTVNAVLPHTENLTYLVADTEYTITAIAEYSDNTTANGTISASTVPGTPADLTRGILD